MGFPDSAFLHTLWDSIVCVLARDELDIRGDKSEIASFDQASRSYSCRPKRAPSCGFPSFERSNSAKYETASKAKVIYNAASIPVPFDHPVSPFTDRPLVLNIASIQFKKGTDLFVKTALEVCKRHDTVEFMWLGAGKHYGDYLDEIRTEGFENRILFPGYVDASFTLLRRAAVFFLSSREDSFPLANLEAMCLARRIVCFDVGGGPEALDGTGILIEPFDTAAAADAILTVLRRPEKDWLNMQARERYLGMFTPQSKLKD